MTTKQTTRDVTIDYLKEMGSAAHCRITIPAGTRAVLVEGQGGGWAVDDIPLIVRLTGNTHDPHYRYAWLPAEAFATGTRHGTSHFVSFDHAARYYRPYGFSPADVERKLTDGEIHLGKPATKPGERVVTIDNGTRYAIETD